jgi:hypothetical protein
VIEPNVKHSNSIASPRRSSGAPVAALLILAPVLSELLFGTTRITVIFVLLPQVGIWGCAAILIRELVQRRGLGWHSILLLGISAAIAEECIIQQTSLAPLVGVPPDQVYGRYFGVNWVYFLWAIAYESLWAILMPIQLVELIFLERRDEPWLSSKGIIIASSVCLTACFVAWYSWTQLFLPQVSPGSAYRVPIESQAIALAVIAALVTAALLPMRLPSVLPAVKRDGPRPWLVGLTSFVMAAPWFALVFIAYGATPALPVIVPILCGLLWMGVAWTRFLEWSARPGWSDSCRLAAIFGALGGNMLAGYPLLAAMKAPLIDVSGKVVFNAIAVAGLVVLFRRIRDRSHLA